MSHMLLMCLENYNDNIKRTLCVIGYFLKKRRRLLNTALHSPALKFFDGEGYCGVGIEKVCNIAMHMCHIGSSVGYDRGSYACAQSSVQKNQKKPA